MTLTQEQIERIRKSQREGCELKPIIPGLTKEHIEYIMKTEPEFEEPDLSDEEMKTLDEMWRKIGEEEAAKAAKKPPLDE